ncbi:MAG TPA: lipid II flippase MurJ [Terriglobales bacterium]|jgi:putative peptidoglycan lipid II flippase|nr:lipid II flippase MurJ [Terriglobales bacterium]
MPHPEAVKTIPDSRRLGLYLSAITALQILVSFAMQWYVVAWFGAAREADAFYTGGTFPLMLKILLVDTLISVLVPLLAADSEDELRRNGWLLFVVITSTFVFVALGLSLASPLLIPLIVPGLSPTAKALSITLGQIQAFGLIGNAAIAVLSTLYQVRHKFIWPALSVLLSGIASSAILIWQLPHWGIKLAAWMQVLAFTLPVILLLPVLGKSPRMQWRLRLVSETWGKMRPMILGKAYYMSAAPLDRILTSFLPPGSIVIFTLAGRFYDAVLRVVTQGVLTPFLPQLARLAHKKDWREFRSLYRRQCWAILGITCVMVVGIMVAAFVSQQVFHPYPVRPVVGRMNSADLARIWMLLVYMAGMLPCAAVANALANTYYAQGDTGTPTKIGAVAFTIGLGMKALGWYFGGIKGMALSVTLWAMLSCIMLAYLIAKRVSGLIKQGESAMAEPVPASASFEQECGECPVLSPQYSEKN